MVVFSVPLLIAGAYGLCASYIPDSSATASTFRLVQAAIGLVSSEAGRSVEKAVAEWLVWPALRFSLAPMGLVLLVAGLFRSGGDPREAASGAAAQAGKPRQEKQQGDSATGGSQVDADKKTSAEKRYLKKMEKAANGLAKKGDPLEAAELLFGAGHFEKAAEYFIEAEAYLRAAEIRHDQNRFIESAELYVKAGRHDSAGSIFAQQDEYIRAAECFLAIGSTSVAAEMYEKGGDDRHAADCYREADFLRHAASAYVKCKAWAKAAECLDQVYREESLRNRGDGKLQQDLAKLVRQAGKLYLRAEDPEKAMAIREKGGCFAEAAELALKLQQYPHAAELFQEANDPPRAAEALREAGEDAEAARILGNFHRDRGESKAAAECFEEAGELLAAGDLYRLLEEYAKAGDCFLRVAEHTQAAEMYALADDRGCAAECYAEGHRYKEAAECYALIGKADKEAEFLELDGQYLRAGRIFRQEGLDDSAITALQKLEPEDEGFSEASALLGDIFQARGQLSLAITKLKQAVGDRELDRDSLPIYYSLATLYSEDENIVLAVEIFEKILTFDYHYQDVEQRLAAARSQIQDAPPATPPGATGTRAIGEDGQPGRYQIVGELGRGGMGIVYKAKDTSLDRLVAYKVLPESLQENSQALRNFLREAKAAAKLNHPNIVTVYDTGAQDGRYYIAMELVDGTTLKEILVRRGVIAPAGVMHVLVQMCEAMAYAHDKKVVHRDIKTANVMWTRDKKAKLMDFGLAKVIEEVRNHTTVVSGTPYYMSPEQTLGKNIDHRTDIYSLGVTMFELATGSVPFKEGNIPYHHVHTPPPDVAHAQPELPVTLVSVINRCLRKDPNERYQSTREILDELRSSLTKTAG